MIDTISKVISIVLIFLMLVTAPLLISYKMDDATARREVLFEVTQFIDKVRDTRKISPDELDQLYADCNSYGLSVDVRVRRLTKYVVSEEDGVKIDYFISDVPETLSKADKGVLPSEVSFNKGDGVQVIISEVGISPSRSFMTSRLTVWFSLLTIKQFGKR